MKKDNFNIHKEGTKCQNCNYGILSKYHKEKCITVCMFSSKEQIIDYKIFKPMVLEVVL